MAFSPDGKTVLTGSRERRRDSGTPPPGCPSARPSAIPSESSAVAFSPDGKRLLTGSYDGKARLFRNVPELPDDLERVAAWVEVLTGLVARGGAGHDPGARQRGLAEPSRTTRATGRSSRNRGRTEARSHLVWFRPDGPRSSLDGTWTVGRGRGRNRRARPSSTVQRFELDRARPIPHRPRPIPHRPRRAGESRRRLHPGNPDRAKNLGLRYCQALSLLAQGDQAGLRQACSDLLGRFGATADPQTANSVAWSCVLGPDSVADRKAPVRLAELAVKGAPANQRPTLLNTLGAASPAPGGSRNRFAAWRKASESEAARVYPRTGRSWRWLINNSGMAQEARRWLDRFHTCKANENPDSFWNELEVRLLRREAEAAIRFDPIFPSDPFARAPL